MLFLRSGRSGFFFAITLQLVAQGTFADAQFFGSQLAYPVDGSERIQDVPNQNVTHNITVSSQSIQAALLNPLIFSLITNINPIQQKQHRFLHKTFIHPTIKPRALFNAK